MMLIKQLLYTQSVVVGGGFKTSKNWGSSKFKY